MYGPNIFRLHNMHSELAILHDAVLVEYLVPPCVFILHSELLYLSLSFGDGGYGFAESFS